MSEKKKLLLIGGGGHCKSVIPIIEETLEYEIVGISDKQENLNKKILKHSIIITDKELEKYDKKANYAFITLGSIKNAKKRENLYSKLKQIGYHFPIIQSKHSIISKYSNIEEGTVIMPGVVINPGVTIGKNCIINTGSIIEHDCKIDDHTHIAPGVTISGGVRIGKCSHIGTGTTIIQNIEITENCIIGAASLVLKDISDPGIYYGIPTKKGRK